MTWKPTASSSLVHNRQTHAWRSPALSGYAARRAATNGPSGATSRQDGSGRPASARKDARAPPCPDGVFGQGDAIGRSRSLSKVVEEVVTWGHLRATQAAPCVRPGKLAVTPGAPPVLRSTASLDGNARCGANSTGRHPMLDCAAGAIGNSILGGLQLNTLQDRTRHQDQGQRRFGCG